MFKVNCVFLRKSYTLRYYLGKLFKGNRKLIGFFGFIYIFLFSFVFNMLFVTFDVEFVNLLADTFISEFPIYENIATFAIYPNLSLVTYVFSVFGLPFHLYYWNRTFPTRVERADKKQQVFVCFFILAGMLSLLLHSLITKQSLIESPRYQYLFNDYCMFYLSHSITVTTISALLVALFKSVLKS